MYPVVDCTRCCAVIHSNEIKIPQRHHTRSQLMSTFNPDLTRMEGGLLSVKTVCPFVLRSCNKFQFWSLFSLCTIMLRLCVGGDSDLYGDVVLLQKAMAQLDKNDRQEVLDNDWLKKEVNSSGHFFSVYVCSFDW